MYSMYSNINADREKLKGTVLQKIFFNENYLKLQTDKGNFCFTVAGDCCSNSLFYDFIGVQKILGKKIVVMKEVELNPTDIEKRGDWGGVVDKKGENDDIKVYGYQIVVDDPEWGELTGVFSFRNYSNGYYGGYMEECEDREVLPEIVDDVVESAPYITN